MDFSTGRPSVIAPVGSPAKLDLPEVDGFPGGWAGWAKLDVMDAGGFELDLTELDQLGSRLKNPHEHGKGITQSVRALTIIRTISQRVARFWGGETNSEKGRTRS